ncbi:uncharacterized protein A4U43_C07F33430 [Asparagus officinalis]|uniref:Phytocyanin domain-containing protein n=1 Tax=Asparagus officinalis TaxID=4686 RepID=A0A5P1EH79_ASPOF|nr:mavicyanin-like [Asparagus officinalis]ONK65083.1 uncharacterized protein A4U43_C07F33430 [Asparagus officinalis]
MACKSTTALLAIFAFAIPTLIGATEHIVGDDNGWTLGFNYTAWAQGKEFRVGDTLVFNYPIGDHNVIKVTGPDFKSCSVPSTAEPLTTGNDVIILATAGRKWYICGVDSGEGTHCDAGQKLVITVFDAEVEAPSPAMASDASAPSPAVMDIDVEADLVPSPAPISGETPNEQYYFFNRFLKV